MILPRSLCGTALRKERRGKNETCQNSERSVDHRHWLQAVAVPYSLSSLTLHLKDTIPLGVEALFLSVACDKTFHLSNRPHLLPWLFKL